MSANWLSDAAIEGLSPSDKARSSFAASVSIIA